jgi:CRISPR-associated protein Cas2
MTYLFAYDITDYRRRCRVAKKLEQFGLRVQKSFFQCDVSPELAGRIKSALLHIINEKEDSLLCYPVCADCLGGVSLLGAGTLSSDAGFEVL